MLCQWLLRQGAQSSLGRGRVPDSPIHFLQSPHCGCETRRYYFKRSPGQVPWHKNLYLVDKTVLSDHYCDIAVITRCNRATMGPFPRASCDLQLHPASKGLEEDGKGPARWEQVQALSRGSRYRQCHALTWRVVLGRSSTRSGRATGSYPTAPSLLREKVRAAPGSQDWPRGNVAARTQRRVLQWFFLQRKIF